MDASTIPAPTAFSRGSIVTASIGSIAYELGEIRPIDEIDFLRDDPRRLELYRLAGFQNYAASELSMRELARRSAIGTLRGSGIEPGRIGICVFVAESHDRDESMSAEELNRLLSDLGLVDAMPIHVSGSNCANILTAIRVATSFVACGETEYVLIVSVDKAPRRPGGRKMFQEMTIKSDASLSCLIGRPGLLSYDIQHLGQHSSATLVDAGAMDAKQYAMVKFNNIRGCAKRARSALSADVTDFTRVVVNNYGREIANTFVELCGFPKRYGFLGNIGRFAHAVAGDVVINLRDLEVDAAVGPGDRLFVMADSITSSSVMCVQKR